MSTLTADLPKLSSLQATRRPDGEETHLWPRKRERLEQRKEAFVNVTAVNNFAKFVSLAAPAVDSIRKAHAVSENALNATLDTCEAIKSEIESEAEKLVSGLVGIKEVQNAIETGRKRLDELPVTLRYVQKDAKSEEIALSRRLEELESQARELEELVDRSSQELDSVKANLAGVLAEEKLRKEERYQMKESEGPQRERLGLMTSFVKVKKGIHEKFSGYEIVSITDGKKVRVALKEESDVFIDIEFDNDHRLVAASTASLFSNTRIEGELRDKAIADNQPSTFIRGIKLLVHNANSLEKELEDLRTKAKTSKKPFEVEYNPSKRMLLALFNRGSIYAKLRVPLDYTVSMVDLIHLERPESSRSLKPVAQQVKDRFAADGRGRRVSDWVLELNELL